MIEEMVTQIMSVGLIVILLAIVIERVIMGELCKHLAKEKGYKGHFWLGFFLGFLGLFYVAFLPDLKLRKYLHMCSMKMQIMDNRLDDIENG